MRKALAGLRPHHTDLLYGVSAEWGAVDFNAKRPYLCVLVASGLMERQEIDTTPDRLCLAKTFTERWRLTKLGAAFLKAREI